MKNEEPGKKRSTLDFLIYFIVKVKNDDIFALASQLAYYLILSFFPFLIFLMTLIGFSNLNSMEVLDGLRSILPSSVFELVSKIVIEVVDTQYTGLLGASIAITIWSASSGFRAVIKGINKAYNMEEDRSFFKRVIVAIFFTFTLALIIILTLAMLVFGDVIGDYLISVLPFKDIIETLWNLTRYVIIVFIMTWIFACIYRYTPATKRKWREVFPGAIISTLGWIGVSLGFSYYINNIANYSRFYGSLGAVFVLMTWLYITSMILILGAEINSVLALRKKQSEE
ncbi:YihY/virulence factor BrkB family protein [Clostridium septicum]|uniref:YihY/virulence factor BrkB family protein n=1 Tax=Clostridium septicum TaxID=1504 RepID=A0A9N7JKM4_CLOSE|nr:YihY/virulence factor BrkB family protein [Clostridium septicum]AYE34158.1 YihY/virulence factor BrkB family protein [Clostridium septicum]MDU1313044.1 YihY/virulence factor BrkB family protein [Clostridium septicum]UEC21213.1 YihY/virulence factor BrkB family protein [Clostridium septicum]USS00740.1 YihY/virulence factor BrkB family protein [Clostridium septicum]WLF69284.1 YihY/virulence factor BrkB family protein [Clostridium septicum]